MPHRNRKNRHHRGQANSIAASGIEKIQAKRERAQRRSEQLEAWWPTIWDEQTGIITAHFGQQVLVESPDGPNGKGKQLRRCHFAPLEQLVVGDRVIQSQSEGLGVVGDRPPRQRPQAPGPYANETGCRQCGPDAGGLLPTSTLLDLVAAELSGIPATLVLNKADLIDEELRPFIDDMKAMYERLGLVLN